VIQDSFTVDTRKVCYFRLRSVSPH